MGANQAKRQNKSLYGAIKSCLVKVRQQQENSKTQLLKDSILPAANFYLPYGKLKRRSFLLCVYGGRKLANLLG